MIANQFESCHPSQQWVPRIALILQSFILFRLKAKQRVKLRKVIKYKKEKMRGIQKRSKKVKRLQTPNQVMAPSCSSGCVSYNSLPLKCLEGTINSTVAEVFPPAHQAASCFSSKCSGLILLQSSGTEFFLELLLELS